MTVLSVFLELFVLLSVRELGHWLVAYALRMPVSSMTVGVGPVLFERLWNGMWFRFRLLPISGTVALCWRSKRPWRNVAGYAAGAAAHILLAGALFLTYLWALSALIAGCTFCAWGAWGSGHEGVRGVAGVRPQGPA